MFFLKKNESYLGVDVGAGGIKLVELKKNKGRPQLWTYGLVKESLDIHLVHHEKTAKELTNESQEKVAGQNFFHQAKKEAEVLISDERIDRYAKLLKDLAKKSRVQTNRVTASLPVSQIFHSVITLPFVPEKERGPIIKAEVAKVLSRPIEEMQVVFQEIPMTVADKEKHYLRLLVTAAPKELISFYTAIFQKAGMQLEELETEAFALERSLVGKDQAVSMVVDLGSERTNFFIIDQGLPLTHRSIQAGGNNIDALLVRALGIKPEAVGQVKLDLSRVGGQNLDSKIFKPIIDEIVKEIESSFDLYLKQSGNMGKKPEKIILTGGTALFPPILATIKDLFPMRVFVGDPWARVVYQQGLKPFLDEIGPSMSVCIGLAMRNFS